jgi:valyl-tRNA synthetase
MVEISKSYEPQAVEEKWYAQWLADGVFHADPASAKPAFSIVIPPPNVTGVLTLGHVLNNTIQDILARRARMQGHEVLWLPGTDHAGIATQTVVERTLRKNEGKTRHDLGREAFLERVWEWKEKHGGIIINQLKKLGCSCDWERERFTMDAGYAPKVQEVFVDLYKKGLIYRGKRMVNWCPVSLTALSDEEVIPKKQKGYLYHFKVEVVEEPGTFLEIATTRPETIPGDTAVAVNPKDPRYAHLIGKHVRRPLPLENLAEIPIIGDEAVDFEFGTGVLKVTPAHDKADYEIGQRHGLEAIDIMNPNGTLNELAGEDFAGLDRFEARVEAVERLRELGVLVKEEPYENNVGFSERADVPIEPRLSEQWFLKYPKTAEARDAVRNGLIRFFPDRWEKVYDHWLENIQDWCISRQLWWGHRIPVWYHRGAGVPPAGFDSAFFDPLGEIDISQRRLPHWTQADASYFVTFRLADSLPAERRESLRAERESWLKNHLPPYTAEQAAEYRELFGERVEQWLDAGHGSCLLADPALSAIVVDSLEHFDGERYDLGSWVVMPNHVHAIVTPRAGHDLSEILHSWKSFTAHEINKRTGRSGELWLSESYDHIVRGERELHQIEEYIERNPEKAGLTAAPRSSRRVSLDGELAADTRRRDACATILCQIESPGDGWVQDTDVLDTWFSSWLWAHETMDAATRAKFYPTSVLVTGPDIIFFWVARMIMAGLEYTGEIPFRDVFFTGIIRDKQGRKMSKSLGNSPDPLDLIAKYGADGLRFGLMRIAPQGQDIKFDEQQIVEGRNFCNKLWNACRFRTMQGPIDPAADPSQHELSIFAQDLLAKLDATILRIEGGYRTYRFNEVAQALYDFVWGEFCDKFIETAKADFHGGDSPRRSGTLAAIDYTISRVLRLLHPYAPFLTEELWHGLGFGSTTIQFAPWPESGSAPGNERADALHAAVAQARNLRATYNLPSNKKLAWAIRPAADWATAELPVLNVLLNAEALEIVTEASENAAVCVTPIGEIYLPLAGIIDADAEKKRLDGELKKVEAEITKVRAKLSSETFVQNAPAAVVEEHRERQRAWEERLEAVRQAREALG